MNFATWFILGSSMSLVSTAARADVVVIVSSVSAVPTLSKSQVADIFLGKTARFPDGSPVAPIDQAEGMPQRDEFYTRIAGKSAAQLKAYWSHLIFTGRGTPPQSVANGVAARKFVAAHPNAICYIDRNDVDASVKVVY